MTHSHIRWNLATREWVIYAPNRRQRPQDFQRKEAEPLIEKSTIDNCPFCSVNLANEEKILLSIPNVSGTGWQVQVVSNKYSALSADVEPKRSISGIYLELPGYGHHEVLIESPDHYQTLATMPLEAVEAVLEGYRQRYWALMQIPANLWVVIFRNHGKSAGASLRHPHSQIIATPIVPRHRRWHEDESQRYFDEWGRCAFCDMAESEQHELLRVVVENDLFLAFIPFAAAVPFEIWILPKDHQSEFGVITPPQVTAFAAILKEVLAKLYKKLNNPDYNFAIITAARYKVNEPHLHWYCQIRPRLTIPAGFEIGSGISINPSLPEADAEFLNGEVKSDTLQ